MEAGSTHFPWNALRNYRKPRILVSLFLTWNANWHTLLMESIALWIRVNALFIQVWIVYWGAVVNQADLDSLISSLRRELDCIEQAIHALEEIARNEGVEVEVPPREAVSSGDARNKLAKPWPKHRVRTS